MPLKIIAIFNWERSQTLDPCLYDIEAVLHQANLHYRAAKKITTTLEDVDSGAI